MLDRSRLVRDARRRFEAEDARKIVNAILADQRPRRTVILTAGNPIPAQSIKPLASAPEVDSHVE